MDNLKEEIREILQENDWRDEFIYDRAIESLIVLIEREKYKVYESIDRQAKD